MLESIITDYLQQHRRLVIPELGAFLKKEGGEVVFAPFLNKEDGVLNEKVRQIYGASTTEAEGIISKYVENVKWTVDSKGVYLLAPLGSLKRDANGLLFLDTGDLNPLASQRGPIVPEAVAPETEPTVVLESESVVLPRPEELPEPRPADSFSVRREPTAPSESPRSGATLVNGEQPAERSARPGAEPSVAEERTDRRAEPATAPPAQTVADTVEAPRTLNDMIRENQLRRETPKTLHTHMTEIAEVSRPTSRTNRPSASVPVGKTTVESETDSGKKGDIILILAVVVALIAIGAMIYAYAIVDLPLFNIQ
ncbi:MAG: hypothetical protein LUD68_00580 [Rikenellaceae bacterium]|nr:hypothetical protein [Rikenellaceae bacterium]